MDGLSVYERLRLRKLIIKGRGTNVYEYLCLMALRVKLSKEW